MLDGGEILVLAFRCLVRLLAFRSLTNRNFTGGIHIIDAANGQSFVIMSFTVIVRGSKIHIKSSDEGITNEQEVEGVRSGNYRGVFTSRG